MHYTPNKYGIKYQVKSPPPAGIFFVPTPCTPPISAGSEKTALVIAIIEETEVLYHFNRPYSS